MTIINEWMNKQINKKVSVVRNLELESFTVHLEKRIMSHTVGSGAM